MKLNIRKYLVMVGFMLLISATLLALTACHPAYKIKVENRTEQVLTIYTDYARFGSPLPIGNVEPSAYIYTSYFDIADSYCQIDAENEEGELIFSKEYFWTELRDMDWEVVILPLEED